MTWQEYAEKQQYARQSALQQGYEQSLIPPETRLDAEDMED